MRATQGKYLFFNILIISFGCLIYTNVSSQTHYQLIIHQAGKDTSLLQSSKLNTIQSLNLQTSFLNKKLCTNYIYKLPAILTAKGFPAASIDSIYYDSVSTHINLYLGEQYKWIS